MKLRISLALLFSLLLSPFAFGQDSGWAVVAKAGTQGFGADVHRALVPKTLNLRAGASFFQYSLDYDDNGIAYGGQLRLGAVPVTLDVYPFKNWFRMSAGLEFNLNRAVGTAKPYQGLVSIHGRSYTVDQIGQLRGTFQFNRVAPLVSIGFCNPIKKNKHWGFFSEIGVLYHGRPRFPISISGPLSSQLSADLLAQRVSVEQDVKKYRFYPILQLGIAYHFGRKER